MKDSTGLVIVHTGDGKGKTTAALGLALRAWGNGMRVLIMQFIKGGQNYGELNAIETLKDSHMVIEQCGLGFTHGAKGIHQDAAEAAINMAHREITSGKWDMIILDEINYAVKFGLITVDDVLSLIDIRPAELHLVLTGRDASSAIIDRADLVTEMKLVKHPFQKGVAAQAGIEF